LHYNRYRYYNPQTAQYLSPDPLGLEGGFTPQSYVHNPNGWIDPLGLTCKGGGGDVPKRSADGRLRNADGTFAYDGGSKRVPNPTHGNTKTPDTTATLYGKFDADGNFLKWGKSQNPHTRYTSKELNGGFIKEYMAGPTDQILNRERRLVERFPGPENNEPWAGSRRPK